MTERGEAAKRDQEATGAIVRLREAVGRFEDDYLRKILTLLDGNVSRVASELGISRQTLYTKFKRHGIEPDGRWGAGGLRRPSRRGGTRPIVQNS